MNRIFHPKVGLSLYFVMGFLFTQLFYFFWIKEILVAVLIVLLELFLIESVIHTRYVISPDGQLKLHVGRFFPDRTIPVGEILSVKRSHSWQGSAALSHERILIVFKGKFGEETAAVSPKKEQEFIEALLRLNPDVQVDEKLPYTKTF